MSGLFRRTVGHLANGAGVGLEFLQAILDGLKLAFLDGAVGGVLTSPSLFDVESVDVNRGSFWSGALHDVAHVDSTQVGGLLEMARGENIFEDFKKNFGPVGRVAKNAGRTGRR